MAQWEVEIKEMIAHQREELDYGSEIEEYWRNNPGGYSEDFWRDHTTNLTKRVFLCFLNMNLVRPVAVRKLWTILMVYQPRRIRLRVILRL